MAGATGGGLALFLTQARPGELAASVRALPPFAGAAALAAGLVGLGLTALRRRWLLAAAGVEASVPRLALPEGQCPQEGNAAPSS